MRHLAIVLLGYAIVLSQVGAAGAGDPCPADLNGDGEVNAADLAMLLGSWGPCPECQDAADCDDANPCTSDACVEQVCEYEPIEDGTACDDDDVCTVNETCAGGVCVGEPAPELCDGVDNDCDPDTTDGSGDPQVGSPCDGDDTDLCPEGTYDCVGGGLICDDTTGSDLDVCDGVDNDCDPSSSDGSEDPLGGTACDGADSDLCLEGVYSCVAGALQCSDNTGDNLDLCDGADNDCDPSSPDGWEDPLLGDPCDGADSDLCPEGTYDCVGGGLICDDTTGSDLDVCDGVDNDCDPSSSDGSEDPLVGTACDGADSDLCLEGAYSCVAGALQCSDNTSDNLDLCDGADNDCDPSSPDGWEDPLLGDPCDGADSDLCPEGTYDCVGGGLICDDTTGSDLDVCDGVDNDCDPSSSDGSEDPLGGTACDGADSDLCLEGVYSCVAGALQCSDNTSDNLDLCDGADNDCDPSSPDGWEDPLLGDPCDGSDSDLCPEGVYECAGASGLFCNDTTNDDLDVCDGVDNDCDPSTPDGAEDPQVGQACDGSDSDLCLEGTLFCIGGTLQCNDTTGDNLDLCDGVDNDCDPSTPDGWDDPQVGNPCDGDDSDLCPEGFYECAGASGLLCDDTTGDDLDSCDGLDNDCDPSTPDGAEDPQVGLACDGPDSDMCLEGTLFCAGGSLDCSDATGDDEEICDDNIDNDCDGDTDEGCP